MRIAIVNDMPLAVEALRRALAFEPSHEEVWVAHNGADHIDTAISSFAWGTSHPGTESMDYYLAKASFHDDALLDAVVELIGGAQT